MGTPDLGATQEMTDRGFESKVGVGDDERTKALDAQTRRVFSSARHLTAHQGDAESCDAEPDHLDADPSVMV